MADEPRRCVAVVAVREGRVLLVRRTKPPRAGAWTLPGGGVEAAEADVQAAARELREETGLTGTDLVRIAAHEHRDREAHLHVEIFAAQVVGEPAAGDDAGDARWVELAALSSIETTEALLATALRRWPGAASTGSRPAG